MSTTGHLREMVNRSQVQEYDLRKLQFWASGTLIQSARKPRKLAEQRICFMAIQWGIFKMPVHYTVVHQLEEGGGLTTELSAVSGAVIVGALSMAGEKISGKRLIVGDIELARA